MKPQISIIVSTYNISKLLANCFLSLINQSTSNNLYEIIVFYNNVKDNTKEIVENFIKVFPNSKISYIGEKNRYLVTREMSDAKKRTVNISFI